MKKYLIINSAQNRAFYKEKEDRYAPEINRQVIKKRGAVIIEGLANSGKTKWLNRINDNSKNIWKNKSVVRISARSPLSEIVEICGTEGDKLYKKINAIAAWSKKNKPVLLLDDANLLSGRKLDVIKQIIINSYCVIISCININQLPTSIRYILLSKKAQIISLQSKASYDATQLLIWLIALICAAAGAWEIAAVAGGASILSRGRGATKST